MTLPTLSFIQGAAGVVADLDAVVEFGIFVEGASRSGKTNVVRIFLEQTYGLFQHIVVDVEGEYVTLRSKERPYLIVGRGRDIALPVDADAIKRFVLAIVDKGVSVIFDLSEHDIEEQQPIVAAICDALVSLPENHPGNAAVVLEELQDFAPEGGGKGTALSSVRRLSKRGLKRGFFTVGVSQRVADVSKGVITQLKNKIIGGTDLKDAPRALEELGLPSKDKSVVTDLAQGDFWVKGPAFARHAQLVRPPRSVTAPPKRKRGDPPAPAAEAPAEIAALAKALAAAAVTESVSPSSTSSDVKKGEILPFSYSNNDLQRARDEARYDEAQRHERYRNVIRAECKSSIEKIRTVGDNVLILFASLMDNLEGVVAGIDEQWVKPVPPDPVIVAPKSTFVAPTAPIVAPMARKPVADGELHATQQRILDSLAELEAIGIRPALRSQAAIFANYGTLSNGTGGQHVGRLIDQQLVSIPKKGEVELTAEGRKRAQREPRPLTRAELHRRILAKLSAVEQRILEYLIRDRREHKRADIATAIGYGTLSNGTGGQYVGKLVALNLVVIPKVGFIQASPLLFPEGLK